MTKFILNVLFLLSFTYTLPSQNFAWIHKSLTPNGIGQLANLTFLDGNYGWSMGDLGDLLKTTNSGKDWYFLGKVDKRSKLNFESRQEFLGIRFVNKNIGFVNSFTLGKPYLNTIYKTTDGGINWRIVYESNIPKSFLTDLSYSYGDVQIFNDSTILCYNNFNFFKSIDQGENWQEILKSSDQTVTNISIRFLNSDTSFVCTNNNRIIRSLNSWKNWATNQTGNFLPPYFQFFNDTLGYLYKNVNSKLQIFKTTNCGNTWNLFSSDTSINISQLKYILFLNPNKGYLIGAFNGRAETYETNDGGVNWKVNDSFDNLWNFSWYDNKGIDTLTVSLFGIYSYGILRTNDGGNTWKGQYPQYPINSGQIHNLLNGYGIWSTNNKYTGNFINDSVGVLLNTIVDQNNLPTDHYIVHSQNSCNDLYGINSLVTDDSIAFKPFSSTNFKDSNIWVSVDDFNNHSRIYYTKDLINWEHLTTFSKPNDKGIEMRFVSETEGWAASGRVFNQQGITPLWAYHTKDGGRNWDSISLNIDYVNNHNGTVSLNWNLFFLDKNNGWIYFNEFDALSFPYTHIICKTTDGGKSWTNTTLNLNKGMNFIKFRDKNNGYATGSNGLFMNTTDGGINWTTLEAPNDLFNNLAFSDDSTIYISTYTTSSNLYSRIFKYNERTKVFTIEYESPFNINSLQFVNNEHGWIAGDGSTIINLNRKDYSLDLIPINIPLFCESDTISIPIALNTKGNFNPENAFIAQLSDSLGNFDSPNNIGIGYGNVINTIQVSVKSNKLSPDTKYKIRVVATSPSLKSNNTLDIKINYVSTPKIIAPSFACINQQVTINVDSIYNDYTFNWSVDDKAVITGSNNNNNVVLLFNKPGISEIKLTIRNKFNGCFKTISKTININSLKASISGNNFICNNSNNPEIYQSLINEPEIKNKWVLTEGGQIVGTDTSNSVQIIWQPGIHDLKLIQSIKDGNCSDTATFTVKVSEKINPISDISGLFEVCPNKTHTYFIKKDSNTTYVWNVIGGSIQGANNLDSVVVKWGVAANGSLNVNSFNKIGCNQNKTQQIYINGFGIKISGDIFACFNDSTKYYIPNVKGISKKWAVNRGQILGDSTGDTVNVYWNTSSGIRSISLKLTTLDGNCTTSLGPITITNKKYDNINIVSQNVNPIEWSNKLFNIPIVINSSRCLGLNDTDFAAVKVKIRKTMFLPQISNTVSYQDVGMDRVISFKIGGNNFKQGDTLLLAGYLLLGDALETDIKIESITYSNNVFPIDTLLPGKLTYIGIPNDYAGLRLMKRKEIYITSIFPNPATDKINITIESNESSENTTLEIFDMIGNKFLSKEIKLVEGTNHQAIEFGNEIESGMYYILLKGTENIETKYFVIGK